MNLMRGERSFAAFDIDGTLVRWQLYHSVADTLSRLGHIDPKLYETIKEARMVWKRREGGFPDYERQVVAVYDKVVTSLSRDQFDTAAKAVFVEYKDQVYTYTRDLIAKLKKDGYLLFAISGSQTEIVKLIAEYYGFDDYIGSVYEHKDGKFTGAKVVAAWHKDKALKELVAKHEAGFGGSIAVGDSHSDIKMMKLVEQPVAFNPERQLFTHAAKNKWKIVVERKNVVYQLESRDGKYELVKTD